MEKINLVDLTVNGDKSFFGMSDKLLVSTKKIFPSPEVAVVGLITVAMHLAQENSIPDEYIQNALLALDRAYNTQDIMQ